MLERHLITIYRQKVSVVLIEIWVILHFALGCHISRVDKMYASFGLVRTIIVYKNGHFLLRVRPGGSCVRDHFIDLGFGLIVAVFATKSCC